MHKILMIDDEKSVREGMQKMLEIKGFSVNIAADGIEAIEIIEKEEPDLVITDIIMPEKDGIEVILEIKKNHKGIKIIAISGGGRINAQDHLEIASQFGVNSTLTKPFSFDELYFEICKILNIRED